MVRLTTPGPAFARHGADFSFSARGDQLWTFIRSRAMLRLCACNAPVRQQRGPCLALLRDLFGETSDPPRWASKFGYQLYSAHSTLPFHPSLPLALLKLPAHCSFTEPIPHSFCVLEQVACHINTVTFIIIQGCGKKRSYTRHPSWGSVRGLPSVSREPEEVHFVHTLSLFGGEPPTTKQDDGVWANSFMVGTWK